MELPNFIKKNKDKIIEIAKWSNKTGRESAIVDFLNNKTKTFYSDESLYIIYPYETTKNDLHIHPLPEDKISDNFFETEQITLDYVLFSLFKVFQSGGDMKAVMWHNEINKKNTSFNSYVASLDSENKILYIRDYSTSVIKNIKYNVLTEKIINTMSQFKKEFTEVYLSYDIEYLTTDGVDKFHDAIMNEMENKKTTKKIKKYLDDNFILYTIKL